MLVCQLAVRFGIAVADEQQLDIMLAQARLQLRQCWSNFCTKAASGAPVDQKYPLVLEILQRNYLARKIGQAERSHHCAWGEADRFRRPAWNR